MASASAGGAVRNVPTPVPRNNVLVRQRIAAFINVKPLDTESTMLLHLVCRSMKLMSLAGSLRLSANAYSPLAGSPAVLALLLPIAMSGCLRALPGADAGIQWSKLVFTFADDPAKRTVRPGICAVAKAAWGAGDDGLQKLTAAQAAYTLNFVSALP